MVPGRSARSPWGRHLLVAALIALLLSLGLFEEDLFVVLGRLCHLGGWASAAVPGVTGHGWAVAISYRLLYVLLNMALLHLLLRGRYTKAALVGYAVGYAGSVGLLLLAQHAGLPAAAVTAHRVLDVLSSPLPIMFMYPLAALAGRQARL